MFSCKLFCEKARMNRKTIKSSDEQTLFYAIEHNDVEALTRLIKRNVDVNHTFHGGPLSKSYWTCLHICCERGRFDACKLFLQSGADPNIVDNNGQTPLMYAASTGWRNLTRLLLSYGADTNMKDASSRTVMHVAAACEDQRIIKELLSSGGGINKMDIAGRTPLWLAASYSVGVDTMKAIVQSTGVDVINACDTRRGRNALQAAIMMTRHDLYEKVEVLVNNGLDIYNTDFRFYTPVMNIVQRLYEEEAKSQLTPTLKHDLLKSLDLLLQTGYDINLHTAGERIFDHNGSALHLVSRLGLSYVANILIGYGANVDQKNTKGMTPLHVAAQYWYIEVAKVLIENGCNMEVISPFSFGKKSLYGTPFRVAIETGGLTMALFMVDAGYNLLEESYLSDEIDIPDILYKNNKLFQYLQHIKMNRENNIPDALCLMCFKLLRFHFSSNLKERVESLGIPKYLKDIICYAEFLS